jgi:hypothetical protein
MNPDLNNLSADQLRRAADIKERIDALHEELERTLAMADGISVAQRSTVVPLRFPRPFRSARPRTANAPSVPSSCQRPVQNRPV